METKHLIVGMAIIILLASVIQSFQISSLKNKITANAVQAGNIVDMTGWTADEKMQYEHHGILPARFKQSAGQTS